MMENGSGEKKQIILNCEKMETRVAFLSKGRLEEYEIERPNEQAIVGSIYLARIVNLEPSLQAAFVDIGGEKNAFLHYWDMLPASYDMFDKVSKNESPQEQPVKKQSSFSDKIRKLLGNKPKNIKEIENTKRKRKKITVKDIPNLFPPGSELLVQVTKGPIGTKGPRVTTNITIPGRYLVLLPYSDHLCLSSKIENKTERARLRKILTGLDLPEGMGLICRTVGEGRKSVYFKRDMDMLLDYWHKVETSMQNPTIPSVVYREPTLIERTIRDFLTDEIDEIIVDNLDACKSLQTLLGKFMGRKFASKVKIHKKARPIFEYYRIKEQIANVFKREAPLPNGGYICVDETEALIAIDVNTGKGRTRKDQPEVILETNIEAAEEVARQLKLRNVGGLVVIDFIDMRVSKDRDKLYKYMCSLVKSDKAKTKVLPLSKLGLMEMTRQREHESLQSTVYAPCPYCKGMGRIKSSMSMSVEIQRRLHEVLRRYGSKKNFSVRVIIHPTILARLKNEDASILIELEKKYGQSLTFRADENIHHEEFRIIDPETNAEY
jgi:ribonuclease G